MKIGEIMKKEVITADPNEKIEKVSQILFTNRFHALPVVENGKLMGIITESDFFIKDQSNLFLPSYIDFLEKSRNLNDLSKEKGEQVQKLLNAKVKDIMTKNCLSFSPDNDIFEVLKKYKETGFNTFPVVENDKLVGVVTCSDIIGLIH